MRNLFGRLLTCTITASISLIALGQEQETTKYEWTLKTQDRVWKIEHFQEAENSRTNIYLGDLEFQSILKKGETHYTIDHLSKKMTVLPSRGNRRGPPQAGHPPMDHRENSSPTVDLEELKQTGSKKVAGINSQGYQLQIDKLSIEISLLEGNGLFSPTFFHQFSETKLISRELNGICKQVRGLPSELILKKKEKEIFNLSLISKEDTSSEESLFEIPKDYTLISMPSRKNGKSKGGKGKRGGEHGNRPPQ